MLWGSFKNIQKSLVYNNNCLRSNGYATTDAVHTSKNKCSSLICVKCVQLGSYSSEIVVCLLSITYFVLD